MVQTKVNLRFNLAIDLDGSNFKLSLTPFDSSIRVKSHFIYVEQRNTDHNYVFHTPFN